ncbi:S41 family peptidase [Acinetobacter sp. C_4_1]|uniref:S41 family peptidase n=1 Tax=unclassified Acinetobacter TaxID=196816 RepID=UPI0021B7966E|nr:MULTISPECIES: S41 family peptidase [unclassified Acinetobacter]MCT8088523.1 S41 family peptidase [Acinetobacter sp. F_3_1]MCT8096679.1 S41 family peptidase [Acinetobacter sp. C_3_1]MCT8099554.1 S41 family peptidase [Acinetobacter sp. C_4_1]MCT8133522.1 S41 family peptidase [Acinetobacter sp. T_3_1]
MALQRWNKVVILTTLFMCVSHSALAAVKGKVQPVLDFDDEVEQNYAEVPVESIQQFVQIYSIVKENYVDAKNDEALFQQAIKGLVSGLDRYSRYLSPEDYKQLLQYTEGDIASVDFELAYDSQLHQWVIRRLKENADSAKQGLRNGVSVFKIDDQELKKFNHDQVNSLLNGSIGSTLSLQLAPSSKPLILVRNKKIETDIQATLLHNQVLVIKVKVFQQDTANEIKRLIEEHSSSRLKAVLLDLRNNPGGLLSAAVESADLFLNQGIIVSTKSRSEGDQQFQALPSFEFQNLKLGILINNRSASAAEVFTAALKDHGRAWVVGDKSYGKGVVQKLFPLSNGAALQMTVSHYYTPKGQMIEGVGIQPNQPYLLQHDMKEENYLEHVAEIILSHK